MSKEAFNNLLQGIFNVFIKLFQIVSNLFLKLEVMPQNIENLISDILYIVQIVYTVYLVNVL